jgi:hypothetical protein
MVLHSGVTSDDNNVLYSSKSYKKDFESFNNEEITKG